MNSKYYPFFFLITLPLLSTAQSIVLNPDGTHSVVIDQGSTSLVINPDGSHSVGINHGNTTTIINPDGSHSVGINPSSSTSETDQSDSYSFELAQIQKREYENSLFQADSEQYADELTKYKILRHRGIINRTEFKELKNQIRSDKQIANSNKANRIYSLSRLLNSNEISFETFLDQKRKIIEAESKAG